MAYLSGTEIVAAIKRLPDPAGTTGVVTVPGTISLAQATGTVTLTSTVAHNLLVGDIVNIAGAAQADYNGSFIIATVPTSTTATYKIPNTGATSPATGTITAKELTPAWAVANKCGAGDGLLILPTSITRKADIDVDDSLGTFFSTDGTPGPVTVEGSLPVYLRYDGAHQNLIAATLGLATDPTQVVAGFAWSHIAKWSKAVDGIFYTFAKNMKNYVEEYPSLKVAGFTIKGEVGKPLQITYDIIATSKVPDSTINTTATMASVTYFETSNRVRFSEGVFRLNTASGSALAAGDVIYPSGFELSVKRKLSGFHTGQYTEATGAAKQEWVNEPSNDGQPDISLKLDFPRHTSSSRVVELSNDTRKKMDITFTGALISGSTYRSIKFELPHLQLKTVDITDAQGVITEPVEFIVHAATAPPTGMTVTDPFWVTFINRRSTNMLL